MRIVHIMIFEKFTSPYIKFINTHLNIEEHQFFVVGKDYGKYDIERLPNVKIIDSLLSAAKFNVRLHIADKIIIHGLWNNKVIKLLLAQPWLIKKCYWMMWGGDFYNYKHETKDKIKLIRKLRHFVGFVKGDFDLVKKFYHTNGIYHNCVLYPVSFYEDFETENNIHTNEHIQIIVGNSADPSNNHLEIFKRLEKFKAESIIINVPLSYGGMEYALEVEKEGFRIFGNKFKPLKKIIDLEEYNLYLKRMDIGIFFHNRQQGTGNILPLLIGGKKVFLRKGVTTWEMLQDIGVIVYDACDLNLDPIDEQVSINNQQKLKQHFSREAYIRQLTKLFYE